MAVLLLVKRPNPVSSPARVQYHDVGDYLSREQKLAIAKEATLDNVSWEDISPDKHGDWINQRFDGHELLRPLIRRREERSSEQALFECYSFGMQNKCDAWVVNSSSKSLRDSVTRAFRFFNSSLSELTASTATRTDRETFLKSQLARDPRKFKWTVTAESRFLRGEPVAVGETGFRTAAYRPFFRQNVYWDRSIAHSIRKLDGIFDISSNRVPGIMVSEKAPSLGVLAVDDLPDDAVVGPSSLFLPRDMPRVSSQLDSQSELILNDETADRSNISDGAHNDYRRRYGAWVSKANIFSYVYGILHSPDYRQRYAVSLQKELPRIPEVAASEVFQSISKAGQKLLDLHLGYERVKPFGLIEQRSSDANPDDPVTYRVKKMRFAGSGRNRDLSSLIYNDKIKLNGIPEETHEYFVGSKTALGWVMDRYQVRTDKNSGIVNDPNDWATEHGQPRYILDLVKRIVTVSLETLRIVRNLPPLDEAP